MGGGTHIPYKVPHWQSYVVDENVPELLKAQKALADKGLKDPWLRNEVWRYDARVVGTGRMRAHSIFFRGLVPGLVLGGSLGLAVRWYRSQNAHH